MYILKTEDDLWGDNMRCRKYRKNLKPKIKIMVFLFYLLFFVVLIECQLRPLIKTIAASQAKLISNNAINEAVGEELEKSSVDYSDLVHIERDTGGKVLAISTDMVKMNALKSAVSVAIQNKINNTKEQNTSVPLGTLIGNDFLRGRGPDIPLRISLSGSVYTEFKSTFVAAGINQTRHQIYLNIRTSIYVLIPGYNVSTDIETNIAVAETVIVGEVPEVFANLDSEDTSDISDLAQLK